VAEVLELPHLAQRDGMAEVEVRCGGVDAELDVERISPFELLPEPGDRDDIVDTARDDMELFFYGKHRHWLLACTGITW